MRCFWLGLVYLTGCDVVFQLESVYEPAHYGQVINDPDGDQDDDGEPNATDLCVLVPNTEIGGRADTDGDGVGDLCDPDPFVGGHCLALFDSFQAGALSPHWLFDGEQIRYDQDILIIPGGRESIVYLDTPLDLDALYVGGYVQIGANAEGDRHAVQIFFDVARTPLVGGRACGAESDDVLSQVTVVDVAGGVDTIDQAHPLDSTLISAGTTLDIEWTPAGCRAELWTTGDSIDGTIAVKPPPGGVFALRVVYAGFHIYYVAGYGRGCTD